MNGIEPIEPINPVKELVKDKIFPKKDSKPQFLSAQEYGKLTNEEKTLIPEVVKEKGLNHTEFEKQMKKLWPKKVVFKTKWRNK